MSHQGILQKSLNGNVGERKGRIYSDLFLVEIHDTGIRFYDGQLTLCGEWFGV